MSAPIPNQPVTLAFNGYHRQLIAAPDLSICEVGRATPGGEYQRRCWHPACFLGELGDYALRIRALGEDLVAFKTLSLVGELT